jgi:FKBP-type peptidyl-prolyl cis-trans isomerase
MRLKWVVILGVVLLAAHAGAGETPAPKTQKEKMSYATGVEVARNLKGQGVDVDLDLMVRGLRDVLSGETLLMTDEDLRKTITDFQNELRLKQNELRRKQAQAPRPVPEDNKKEGDAFLAENKTKEGVVTLPSGLQYKVLKAGDGNKPTDADTVEINYRGTLINGTEVDSSYRRGQPANFEVKRVIPGWGEALKLMPVGSRWLLFIPPELAYGTKGVGRDIRPNATLIFELELIAIK